MLQQSDKVVSILLNGKTVTVSIDRVKPAYMLHDPHNTYTHTYSQTQQNTTPQTTKETNAEESGVRKHVPDVGSTSLIIIARNPVSGGGWCSESVII